MNIVNMDQSMRVVEQSGTPYREVDFTCRADNKMDSPDRSSRAAKEFPPGAGDDEQASAAIDLPTDVIMFSQ